MPARGTGLNHGTLNPQARLTRARRRFFLEARIMSGIKGLFRKKPKPVPVITMAGPDPENAQNEVVLAGHGSFNPEVDGRYNGGRVRLPVGVTIYFWCLHGETLADEIG